LEFKSRVIVSSVVVAVLIVAVFAIQFIALNQEVSTTHGEYRLDETFTSQDLIYGSQGWAPYASKIPLIPGRNVDSDQFYIMFVDLNATSNLNSTFPRVQVDYILTGLHGIAAFHVYGYIQGNGGIQWTNRVEGAGANGYYVTNDPKPTTALNGTEAMEDYSQVYFKVANTAGVSFDDYGNNTYFMRFGKAGGGLNSLHITTNPQIPTGQVTNTSNLAGTFFVNFTGDRTQNDFILLVAVNGAIESDFSLNLKSSVPD
jgi:hypothetical protein